MGKHVQKRKRKINWKAFGGVIFILLCMGVSVYAWHKSIQAEGANNQQSDAAAIETDTTKNKSIYNILILGIDKRRDDIGRSNVTCVMTVDLEKGKVSMLWIPRDSRVDIPGYEWNKIGHAYAYAGPALSEKTVSKLLGIPMDYYLAVNMSGFKNVIDAIGGVDINVDKKMYYYDPYDEGEVDNDGLIDLKPGLQHMDGNTALEYVRFRHDEMGDIGRIERQQKFANALLNAIVSPSIVTKLPDIMKQIKDSFDTDIPVSDMIRMSMSVHAIYKNGLHTEMVQGTPVYINNISYWLPNIEKMRSQVARLQNITETDAYKNDTAQMIAEYKNSVKNKKVEIAQ